MKKLDLLGQRFGRLVVAGEAETSAGSRRWHCVCDCGNKNVVRAANLRSGHTSSCGCWMAESRRGRRIEREVMTHTDPRGYLSDRCLIGENGCWNWTRYRMKNHYAVVGYGRGKKVYAHRLSYETFVGPIPPGLFVCHHCDNKGCINPAHLFLGTCADNVRDMRNKGRARDVGSHGERNGSSKLGADQVAEIRSIYERGSITQPVLATMYGVSRSNISAIVRGETWRPVAS